MKNREIKFLFWNKEKKYMTDLVFPIGSILGINMDIQELQENYAVRQFTGLQDKNGVDVYEGDIITLYDPYTKSQHIAEVIWDDNNCRYAIKYTFIDFDFLITDEIEVIGNIYENKDLLK